MSISLHCHLYITQGHPHQRPILFYTYPCLSFLSYTLSRLASYTLSRIASYTLSMFRLFQKRLNLCSDTTKLPRLRFPGPTLLADLNRSLGCETIYTIYILYCTGTLIDLFFLRADTCPCFSFIYTIYVITKIIFTYTKELPPEWCPSQSIHIYRVPFTYTCTFSITKHQRLRKQRW